MKTFILRCLAHPRWPLVLAAVAVVLVLPSLGSGLNAYDYVQRATLLGLSPVAPDHGPLFEMFRFVPGTAAGNQALRDLGLLPWWSHPQVRIAFLRPLAAATHWLDLQLWPDDFVLQHAHSLLWLALAVLVAARVFRAIHGPGPVAGLAGLLFALEDAHALPAGWLTDRNGLMVLVWGGLAVVWHLRWRGPEGRARDLLVALASFAAALLCKEAALGVVAYLIAWELCLAGGPLRRRLARLLPYAALVVIWRLAYNALGFGVKGSGLYFDPLHDPVGFAVAIAEHGPVLLLGQWTQFPVDLWIVLSPPARIAASAAGLVLAVGLAALLADLLRARAEARFWALGMLLALLPVSAVMPMARQLTFAGLGACGLIAMLAERLGLLRPAGGESPVRHGRLRRVLTWGLLALHLPLAAVLLSGWMLVMGPAFAVFFRAPAEQAPADPAVTRQTLVFVNGDDLVCYIPHIRALEGGRIPARLALLSTATTASELTRRDQRSLLIRPDEGFLARRSDRFYRSLVPPFVRGQRLAGSDFVAEVVEVTPEGRPAAVVFHFPAPLEDERFRWLWWRHGRLDEFPLPAVGETVRLEATMPGRPEAER